MLEIFRGLGPMATPTVPHLPFAVLVIWSPFLRVCLNPLNFNIHPWCHGWSCVSKCKWDFEM